jgi:hypothetical protein
MLPNSLPHLITMTILVAKLQYFISVKTLYVESMTWNSQNVNLMQYFQKNIKITYYNLEIKVSLVKWYIV